MVTASTVESVALPPLVSGTRTMLVVVRLPLPAYHALCAATAGRPAG